MPIGSRCAYNDPEFHALLVLTIVLLFSGTLFYAHYEGWSYIDALYFCVMTMSTIGYGDLTPTSGFSKIFTIVYALITIGLFVAMASKLASAVISKKHKRFGKHVSAEGEHTR
jgi:voltage-gated potassium channel